MSDGPDRGTRAFSAVVFDWDGTAVRSRRDDASELRGLVEELCARGVHLVVASGTHLENVDDQLAARPRGPGRLYASANRGSELWRITAGGPALIERRAPRPGEDGALDRAAEAVVAALEAAGLSPVAVESRFNRRKLDLVAEWADPPKSQIGELLAVAAERVRDAGLGTLADVCDRVRLEGRRAGLADPRVTTDAKHVELGLTDKTDTARTCFPLLGALGVPAAQVLVCGDELGPLGGEPGSDSLLHHPPGLAAPVVSVGVEPEGVPSWVEHLGGGPARFLELLAGRLSRAR